MVRKIYLPPNNYTLTYKIGKEVSMFVLEKFSLVILTRCNLKCRLCCEYVPQNTPFPDMTIEEAQKILGAAFSVVDRIRTLHLTGGGEPFLHPRLANLINTAMSYEDHFDRLMLFTNTTIPISQHVLDTIKRYKEKVIVQLSLYGVNPQKEISIVKALVDEGITCKVEKYYGQEQSFGGWVDFGDWQARNRMEEELDQVFHGCSVTSVLGGNWRTHNGKVHWCSRSQRGMELGLIPDDTGDYVDLLNDNLSYQEKRDKFKQIANARYLSACDYCSGDAGTEDKAKRYPAAEQLL